MVGTGRRGFAPLRQMMRLLVSSENGTGCCPTTSATITPCSSAEQLAPAVFRMKRKQVSQFRMGMFGFGVSVFVIVVSLALAAIVITEKVSSPGATALLFYCTLFLVMPASVVSLVVSIASAFKHRNWLSLAPRKGSLSCWCEPSLRDATRCLR